MALDFIISNFHTVCLNLSCCNRMACVNCLRALRIYVGFAVGMLSRV